MNDQNHSTSFEPMARLDASLDGPIPSADLPRDPAVARVPAAAFIGRTPHKTAAVRAGMIVGTGLLVAIGAAVAMGASPSPSPSAGGTTPGGRGDGNPGKGFGGIFGGPGGFGPGDIGGLGGFGRMFGGGGSGSVAGRGFGAVSVTAISGSSISLATDDGWTRTIAVTSATTITKGGAAATLADLAVRDTVRLSETRNADGTWAITAIEIVQPQVAGTVTAVGSDTITMTLRDGTTQTIRTNGSTTYHLDQADGKRADVSVGSTIVATGAKAADGSLTAISIWVRLPHVAGTVTATTGNTITISRPDGTTVTVHVGSGTTIRVAGVDGAKLSDVKTGMAIVVEGTQRADGSIDATAIGAGDVGVRGFRFGRDHDGNGPAPAASSSPSPSGGAEG